MARYRHYKNYGEDGQCVFLTTTIVDFAPVFRRPELASQMEHHIIEICLKKGAVLHSYVVMHHHIHMLLNLPPATTADSFMRTFKSKASLIVIPQLNEDDRRMLSMQVGLGNRQLWKRSFRSLVVDTERVFNQKAHYIAWNPVRSGFCDEPGEYAWSSSRWWAEGLGSSDSGLDLIGILRRL